MLGKHLFNNIMTSFNYDIYNQLRDNIDWFKRSLLSYDS